MRCPKCRHENDSDADFCSSCGATLDSSGSLLSLNKTLVLVIIVLSSILAVMRDIIIFQTIIKIKPLKF